MKTLKKILSLLLCLALLLSPIGCNIESDDNNNDDGNNSENNGGGDIGGESNSIYSKLLQDVINNSEYKTLINQGEGNSAFYKSAYFDPHPYGFLESQGYNINDIKTNKTDCYTMSYILEEEPNNLYIYTRVKTASDVYTNYLITYALSDQEISDYKLMHKGENNIYYYTQCVFMNDSISRAKTPTKVEKGAIKIDKYDSLVRYFSERQYIDTLSCEIVITNLEEYGFDLKVIPRYIEDDQAKYYNKVYNVPCGTAWPINTEVYNGPGTPGGTLYTKPRTEYSSNLFFTQYISLSTIDCEIFNLS